MSNTKNDHYIPQFYLSSWGTNPRIQFFCLNKEKKTIFCTLPRNVCADRLWNPKIEKYFTEMEQNFWGPVLNKIISAKRIDSLSSQEIISLLSFAIALKTRRKECINRARQDVEKSQQLLETQWLLEGKATFQDIVYLRSKDEEIDTFVFPRVFHPESLFDGQPNHWRMNQLKYLNYGIKEIKNPTISLLTSDNPLHFYLIPNTTSCPASMFLALSPRLLLFGARGIPLFQQMHNTQADVLCQQYNDLLYEKSNLLISQDRQILNTYQQKL